MTDRLQLTFPRLEPPAEITFQALVLQTLQIVTGHKGQPVQAKIYDFGSPVWSHTCELSSHTNENSKVSLFNKTVNGIHTTEDNKI